MELNILKIAADTTNFRKLSNFTHSAYKKNSMCGDFISLKINLKKNIIKDLGYETKSCIYCQASASLISKFVINNNLEAIVKKLKSIDSFYKDQEVVVKGNLFKIFNKNNLNRKDCIYLPVKAISYALKLNLS